MSEIFRIVAINPGSTSTKIGVFDGDEVLFEENIKHSPGELDQFAEISDQYELRTQAVRDALDRHQIDIESVDAFSGRGGSLESCEGGTYRINDVMFQHARQMRKAKHPASLGIVIAQTLAEQFGKQAFCVNPPDVDEFIVEARLTGVPSIYRESRLHALNHKEVARRFAVSIGRDYSDINLVVCHLGGGISIAAHRKGKIIDSNDTIGGDGPMATTRSGALPARALADLCFDETYDQKKINSLISKEGGIVAWFGTTDLKSVVSDLGAGGLPKVVFDAMIYQIVKQIGAMYTALHGDCQAIILTGQISTNEYLVGQITEAVGRLAEVVPMAGEFELEALASGANRVLSGTEQPREYTGKPVFTNINDYLGGQ